MPLLLSTLANTRSPCTTKTRNQLYGTWVADATVDAETYGAFVRATTAAVHRINADKRTYARYYKTHDFEVTPEVQALSLDDFNLSRIQVKAPRAHPRGRCTLGLGLDGELGGCYTVRSMPSHRSTPPCNRPRMPDAECRLLSLSHVDGTGRTTGRGSVTDSCAITPWRKGVHSSRAIAKKALAGIHRTNHIDIQSLRVRFPDACFVSSSPNARVFGLGLIPRSLLRGDLH
jgi:hypothetical protein